MNDMEYRRASVNYNSSLRSGKFQEAIENLLVMAAICIADDMPNDAMKCLAIALCLELTKRRVGGPINPNIMERINVVAKMPILNWSLLLGMFLNDVGRNFSWNGVITLVNACVIFQLCLNGRYDEANSYLETLSALQFDE